MRFPLNSKAIGGYRFQEWTFYNTKHTGTDWVANYWILYAPTNGNIVATPYDYGGGQWVNFQGDDGALHLFAHLSKAFPISRYAEGQQIGVTGNTGNWTSGVHLHESIYKNGNLINPETYYSGGTGGNMDEQIRQIGVRLDNVGGSLAQHTSQIAALGIRLDNVGGSLTQHTAQIQDLKSQLDRIETTLAKVLTDEVLQNAKLEGIKVEPQKGFWELFADTKLGQTSLGQWIINNFRKE